MRIRHFATVALLGLLLGLTACGIKGGPIRPGSDDDPKKQQSSN